MHELNTSSPFFPLPAGMVIVVVHEASASLIVHVSCQDKSAACPLCGERSERVHGQYARTVADLPCAGRRVILALTVRKFVCGMPTCPQKIFTERLPELVRSYARMTNRLREALVALGLATSAEVSERLAPSLGMHVSAPTLLRRVRTIACPPPTSVRILGIDDWAWKKGQTYGTLLVDLERRHPIELLPDRKQQTIEAWLLTHPEIEVISRDRGGEYAAAARKGAPQAQQIADTFHLLLNLREKLKELMARKQKLLPEVEAPTSDAIPDKARGAFSALSPPRAPEAEARAKSFRKMSPHLRTAPSGSAPTWPEDTPSQVSRSNRSARYEAVRTLHQQAVSKPRDRSSPEDVAPDGASVSGRRHHAASAVERRIVAVSLILTNPTFSNAGSRGAGTEPSSLMRSGCVDTLDQTRCFAASLASSASSIRVQEPHRS